MSDSNIIYRPQIQQWFSYITESVGPVTFQLCIWIGNFTEICAAP